VFKEYNDIVTVDDLCEMLSIGKNAAYTLLNNGAIKGFRYGRVWKIAKQAVIDFVLENSHMRISS
jgi:excisionase family DNA binding protein